MKNKPNTIFNSLFGETKSERNLQIEFDDILKNVINPFFKEFGFRKNGNAFNRKLNELIQVVSIQKSKWNDPDEVSFTFNIGFFDSEEYLENSNKEIPKFIRDYDCQIHFRLGHVVKGNDYWYKLNKKTEKENLEIEIYNNLHNHLKAILQSNTEFNYLKEFILNNTYILISSIYKIKLFLKVGDFEKAKELLCKEYFKALNPEDYVSKTIYPDGSEFIKTSKSKINTEYITVLKNIAKHQNIELEN